MCEDEDAPVWDVRRILSSQSRLPNEVMAKVLLGDLLPTLGIVAEMQTCGMCRDEYCFGVLGWRGSQVVRHGSAKAAFVGSIPTLASKPKQLKLRGLENFHLKKPAEMPAKKYSGAILRSGP